DVSPIHQLRRVLGIDDAAFARHGQDVVHQSWPYGREQTPLRRPNLGPLHLADQIDQAHRSLVMVQAVLLVQAYQEALTVWVEQHHQLTGHERSTWSHAGIMRKIGVRRESPAAEIDYRRPAQRMVYVRSPLAATHPACDCWWRDCRQRRRRRRAWAVVVAHGRHIAVTGRGTRRAAVRIAGGCDLSSERWGDR